MSPAFALTRVGHAWALHVVNAIDTPHCRQRSGTAINKAVGSAFMGGTIHAIDSVRYGPSAERSIPS